ncbi:hypothetical protein L7F22_032259 [Adiantum nelumboides]|nr:hypothetical protein [Adiantum nelumboides]
MGEAGQKETAPATAAILGRAPVPLPLCLHESMNSFNVELAGSELPAGNPGSVLTLPTQNIDSQTCEKQKDMDNRELQVEGASVDKNVDVGELEERGQMQKDDVDELDDDHDYDGSQQADRIEGANLSLVQAEDLQASSYMKELIHDHSEECSLPATSSLAALKKIHPSKHTQIDKKYYRCPVCSKQLNSKKGLNGHMRTHSKKSRKDAKLPPMRSVAWGSSKRRSSLARGTNLSAATSDIINGGRTEADADEIRKQEGEEERKEEKEERENGEEKEQEAKEEEEDLKYQEVSAEVVEAAVSLMMISAGLCPSEVVNSGLSCEALAASCPERALNDGVEEEDQVEYKLCSICISGFILNPQAGSTEAHIDNARLAKDDPLDYYAGTMASSKPVVRIHKNKHGGLEGVCPDCKKEFHIVVLD